MTKKRIVLVSDCSDIAFNEMRATILKNLDNPDVVEIEPLARVIPFSIINGNFVLRLMAEAYPPGTIFSIILNPSKIRPERLIGKTKKNNFTFMGANTGVFEWMLRDFGVDELYELNDPGFFPFGGKYVHAPTIAKIANGEDLKDLGNKFPITSLKKIALETGTIVHIDNFGLMKFHGEIPKLEEGQKLLINVNGESVKAIYSTRMMNLETGTWAIYPGSSFGLPELGKVRENGAKQIKANVGDKIKIMIKEDSPAVEVTTSRA